MYKDFFKTDKTSDPNTKLKKQLVCCWTKQILTRFYYIVLETKTDDQIKPQQVTDLLNQLLQCYCELSDAQTPGSKRVITKQNVVEKFYIFSESVITHPDYFSSDIVLKIAAVLIRLIPFCDREFDYNSFIEKGISSILIFNNIN